MIDFNGWSRLPAIKTATIKRPCETNGASGKASALRDCRGFFYLVNNYISSVKETLIRHLLADPSLNSLAFRLVGDNKEDLMQEMALLIWEEPDDKIEKISNYFNFWCVRVMINITGKRGSFTKKYSKKYVNAEDWYFDSQQDYDEETDEVLNRVDDILKHVYWYKRDLFKLYLECGSLRKVEAEVGIPYVSVHNTIKEVRETIKDKL